MKEQGYVLGFLFSEDFERVALIQKTKPDWQAGKLNGLGGKIDTKEEFLHPEKAMRREFLEEAGLDIPEENWEMFAVMEGEQWFANCFRAVGPVDDVQSMEEEVVGVYYVDEIREGNYDSDLLDNLHWLIPMAVIKDFNLAFIGY